MFLDRALASIEGKAHSRADMALPLWHIGSSAVVLAGGVALMLRLDAATWLFVASALGQAAYLTVLAPRFFDAVDPPDAEGRSQTTNAFVIYAAVTAFVMWAHYSGRLQSWDRVGPYWLVLAGGVLAAYAAWVLRQFAFKLAQRDTAAKPATPLVSDNDSEPFDPKQVRRIKVMADYQCHPLWSMDDGTAGNIVPDALGLSAQLTHDLNAWAAEFDASINPDDPTQDRWSPAQRMAHEARGHALAQRLAAERPDLEVYAWDVGQGAAVGVDPSNDSDARP